MHVFACVFVKIAVFAIYWKIREIIIKYVYDFSAARNLFPLRLRAVLINKYRSRT